ncbi:MAG: hypothetical protein KDD73_00590 [Anaerolineales bacterium]|nr:hypothetical protein [Anaerolineales bacterium]
MNPAPSFIVGSLGFAWFADMVDVRLVFLLGAALYFVTALYALSQRPLRESQLVEEGTVGLRPQHPGAEEGGGGRGASAT